MPGAPPAPPRARPPPPRAAPAPPPSGADGEWLASTGLAALAAAERCFCGAWSLLGSELLDGLVALLVRCLQQRHTPSLAHVAAEALLHLVKETGASFSQDTWASVCTELKSCFDGGEVVAVAPPPQIADAAASPTQLVAEVSQRVEKEAPPAGAARAPDPPPLHRLPAAADQPPEARRRRGPPQLPALDVREVAPDAAARGRGDRRGRRRRVGLTELESMAYYLQTLRVLQEADAGRGAAREGRGAAARVGGPRAPHRRRRGVPPHPGLPARAEYLALHQAAVGPSPPSSPAGCSPS